MIKSNITMQEANEFLFAAAAILSDADQLYDLVQEARTLGDTERIVSLTIEFLNARLGEKLDG